MEALRADLLATRRGPDSTVDALSVWAGFRRALVGEELLEEQFAVDWSEHPAFLELDRAVRMLRPFVNRLRGEDTLDLHAARAAALEVAEACRALLDATRQEP